MIILQQLYTRIAIFWLNSAIRRQVLTLRYTTWQHFLLVFFKKKPTAEVYLALNDPYSYMLIQALPKLAQRFNINFVLRLTYNNSPKMSIEHSDWLKWSIKDANALATLYNLTPIQSYPNTKALVSGQQLWILHANTIEKAISVFKQTWNDEFDCYYQVSTPVISYQINNQRRQTTQGHYMPATIFFAGEWFWGIDRLDHLEQRFFATNLQCKSDEVFFTKNKLSLAPYDKKSSGSNKLTGESAELDIFLSLRSPYSYLGLIQAQRLAEHYQLSLKFKLVLPMVMRGFVISQDKQRYIYSDALREAKTENIHFDTFRDPVGQGVINCYQLFAYAQQQNKALPYLLAIFEAVYVQGVDLTSTKNLSNICQGVGIDYQLALAFNDDNPWRQWQDENEQQLAKMNFWGVPCFKYKHIECWGQDRLWQIEQGIIEELQRESEEAILSPVK